MASLFGGSRGKRKIEVHTPLDTSEPAFDLAGFSGVEALSRPFVFHLDMLISQKKDIPFDKLLGQKVTVEVNLPRDKKRYVNGVVRRLSQSRERLQKTEASYRAEVVPKFWFLQHHFRNRIFQQMTVPDILQKVLEGVNVSFEIHGSAQKRDYCVQYQESDFHFASRLMEEEGIYYYFKHTRQDHQMVLAITPQCHAEVVGESKVYFQEDAGGNQDQDVVLAWQKSQEIRPGKLTLWDYCFEMPDKNLQAQQTTVEEVKVGQVEHKLKVAGNDKYEVFEYPGGYAQRFDGVSPSGGDRNADLQKIFEDNKRTAAIRMKQEAVSAIDVYGESRCQQFSAGHKFTLATSVNGTNPVDGHYVLTRVEEEARLEAGFANKGGDARLSYVNRFHCIPYGLPFRPPRTTPRPRMHGTQTAVVVGPTGEEIFTDKYGRVKVQFHWDRDGKHDADSSCWIRVATLWAGQQWGMIHIPRIGQEVIVAFEEGDPDQPIIVGSVYNAKHMPPYTLPTNRTQSGIKSRSTLQGSAETFNELRFEDKKESEDIYFHAQKDFHRVVENDDDLKVTHDQTIEIKNNRTEKVEGEEKVTITKNRTVQITQGSDKLTLDQGDLTIKLDMGKVLIDALDSITLKVGMNSIKIDATGITLNANKIQIQGEIMVTMKGEIIQQNATAIMSIQGGITKIN